jgi:hypothetical protein
MPSQYGMAVLFWALLLAATLRTPFGMARP